MGLGLGLVECVPVLAEWVWVYWSGFGSSGVGLGLAQWVWVWRSGFGSG